MPAALGAVLLAAVLEPTASSTFATAVAAPARDVPHRLLGALRRHLLLTAAAVVFVVALAAAAAGNRRRVRGRPLSERSLRVAPLAGADRAPGNPASGRVRSRRRRDPLRRRRRSGLRLAPMRKDARPPHLRGRRALGHLLLVPRDCRGRLLPRIDRRGAPHPRAVPRLPRPVLRDRAARPRPPYALADDPSRLPGGRPDRRPAARSRPVRGRGEQHDRRRRVRAGGVLPHGRTCDRADRPRPARQRPDRAEPRHARAAPAATRARRGRHRRVPVPVHLRPRPRPDRARRRRGGIDPRAPPGLGRPGSARAPERP